MAEAHTQILLSNTYHLMLQPRGENVKKLGGLHKLIGWNKPMLTDSGGFQIFSLGHGSIAQEIKGRRQISSKHKGTLFKLTEDGAIFKSYIDGAMHLLTPEKSMQVQRDLGADLIVVLDECTPFHVDKNYTRHSMEMSHRWATRSHTEFVRGDTGIQKLYGIVQGGVYEDLRLESCDFVNSNQFFGHAIGGSLGADSAQMNAVVAFTAKRLNESRPIHLLGIGGVKDIFKGVACGIDTFDCVHPTRIARHGGALVKGGNGLGREHINLRNAAYASNAMPIDEQCQCYTCNNFSMGYLHHLLKAKELLAMQLVSIHNVRFMNQLMEDIRGCLDSANDLTVLEKEYTQSQT
jgi:queuine tRNA-ribosyltransferase